MATTHYSGELPKWYRYSGLEEGRREPTTEGLDLLTSFRGANQQNNGRVSNVDSAFLLFGIETGIQRIAIDHDEPELPWQTGNSGEFPYA